MKIINLFFFIVIVSFLIYSVSSADQNECVPQYECGDWQGEGLLATRVCVDSLCGSPSVTERRVQDNQQTGCVPNFVCDSWSECQYNDKSDNLLSGKVNFGGEKSRVCRDENNCGIASFIDKSPCQDSYNLQFSPIEKCNEKYLALIDPSSKKTLAEINLDSWLKNRLDLAFTQGEAKYCPVCFNGIKDNDEEGIDCGGLNCKTCSKERYSLNILSLVFLWSSSIIFSFLSVREAITLRKLKSTNEEQSQWLQN